MSRLYALMVAINAYPHPVPPLYGCRNDILLAADLLQSRAMRSDDVRIRTLVDGQATKATVVTAFREHLGRAGPDDSALFWFSGHGSCCPGYPQLWRVEPDREMQTLVCFDSRAPGGSDLLDKELALLTAGVAAGGGHMLIVLDSCHSGGASRETNLRVRAIDRLTEPPSSDLILPELRAQLALAAAGRPTDLGTRLDHIALSACSAVQQAREFEVGRGIHGVFSWALVEAIKRLGPRATYRQLLTAARCEVEHHVPSQVPELYPSHGRWADRALLNGRVLTPTGPMIMRSVRGEWEINAGACHGLQDRGDDGFKVAVRGRTPVREARVVRVLADRSVVEPMSWSPPESAQLPVVVSEVPLPVCVVRLGATAGHDLPPGLHAVRAAIRTAAPGGKASPHIREAEPRETRAPDLWVMATGSRTAAILAADGGRHTPDLDTSVPDGAVRLVEQLEHIAIWRSLRSFTNPYSALAHAIAVEVVPARPSELVIPAHGAALTPDESGAIHLAYDRPDASSSPVVFVRIRNLGPLPLYGVLLDLTDRFRVHPDLFAGSFIAPGAVAAALDGRPVRFALPPDEPPRPGARTTDWLKLIVSEEPFDSAPFELPRLGGPIGRTRRSTGAGAVPSRLGLRAMRRGDVGLSAAPVDWATVTLPVVTSVPRS